MPVSARFLAAGSLERPLLTLSASSPLLVFGGPYSNVRASEAVMACARDLGIAPDNVICTGDVVAYCAEPEVTSQLVRDWGCHAIQGNCEQQLAAGAEDCGCGFEEGSVCDQLSKGWYPYAAAHVSTETRQWMAGLPATLQFKYAGFTFRVVHGGVRETSRFLFGSMRPTIAEELELAGSDVVIAGHAGLPFIARQGPRTWFNPGVVGMPANDGTADVWYGLVRPSAEGVRLSTHRLRYDHLSAAAALRRAGHADSYARSLVTGLWPSLDILPEAEKGRTGRRIPPRAVSLKVPQRSGAVPWQERHAPEPPA